VEALIIEAAINGNTPKEQQPNVPRTPSEVTTDALVCLDAGAAIIHSHTHETWEPVHSADPYVEAWRPVRERYPDALFFPTNPGGSIDSRHEDRVAHIVKLHELGLTQMSFVEPGSLTVGSVGLDGSPARTGWMYINTHDQIAAQFDFCRDRGLIPRIVIFDPNFLRMTLAYHAHQPLPAASILTLVFNNGPLLCALPATVQSLELYLRMLEGTGLRWMVGGYCDIVDSGLARAAIEQGGHVRVGLEDYVGDRHPTNAELVAEVVEIARVAGRPVADSAQAAATLGIAL
jgi:uncharacterized protein (DUF849 family)